MAEEVIQRTITQAPDYLKPGIEKFLEGATLQAGQALDTSKFAPQVAGLRYSRIGPPQPVLPHLTI